MKPDPIAVATSRTWLVLGYAFLYIPILFLVVYSFNASKLSTSWNGFTFQWYVDIAQDRELLEALVRSLKIAFFTACSSVLLGLLAAFSIVRFNRFRGKTLFSGMLNATLVMPEVIVGLSLLLLLVSIQRTLGFPERGSMTIWVGHTLLGMAFAAVVIQSRLAEMDKSLEEAAMDLGCRPLQVFLLVTLPSISQSLLSAWLLTFTLSFDDVVLSAFLSGPGSTTLPIVIFSRAKLGLNPTVNAVATITVLVVSIGVVASSIYLARREKRMLLEQQGALKT